MRRLAPVLVLMVLAPTIGAADGAKEAAKKLEGTYEVLEVTMGGKPDPKKNDTTGVEIKDGQIIAKTKDGDEPAKFTLDPTKTPGHIDLSPPGGDEKVIGIYEVKETDKGTELTIAFSEDQKAARPKDFKGAGKDDVVIKLLRKKAKKLGGD